jgi:hypothetical protein
MDLVNGQSKFFAGTQLPNPKWWVDPMGRVCRAFGLNCPLPVKFSGNHFVSNARFPKKVLK